MPNTTMELFIFGDQTLDVQPCLKGLAQHRHNPVLEDFFTKAYQVLRTEIDQLPHNVKVGLPRFTCIDDIIFRPPGSKSCIALDMAMTTFYQLGVFISQHVNHLGDSRVTCALGLCTGALAAAAVSCSRNALDLVPMAVDAVRVAFRTGAHVLDIAHRIESPDASDQSWLLYVPAVEAAETALKAFREHTLLPGIRQPYITAYTLNSVMVSGPPSSLEQLKRHAPFKELNPQSVSINGPYHAPHLYSQEDVDDIVGDLACQDVHSRSCRVPVIAGDGNPVPDADFGTILKAAVAQILRQQINWNGILKELLTRHDIAGSPTLTVTTIGTKTDHFIYNVLKQSPLREYLSSKPAQSRQPVSNEGAPGPGNDRQKLAIIGMSGRFPGADDIEEFWTLLEQGLDVHKPVPSLRWDAQTHVDRTRARKNTSGTPFGCWLEHPDLFDARFFNISPREAPQIDPAQRLALMTAYEAIEQAGIVPDATPSTRRDRVGVFYGTTSNDWMETNSAQNIDTYFIPGGNRAFIPGRINYYFKFSGPSYAVDTACSSSLASIHLACNALWRREIDTAIAGGTNVLTNPDFTAGLDRGQFLSRTGNCKTFDDSADGYCRGEGVATVIIKRLEDAVADNDPILGLILSASTNHSAESESITRPHVGAQREILSNILNRGASNPYDVSYVEMHGTGTQVGDASEMSSVLETFAPAPNCVKSARGHDTPLYLGSAKANIGHGEAVSGVSSLIKVLLMMQRNTIVPHCGIKTKINHKFPTDLKDRNAHIALKPVSWERSSASLQTRKVVVNNFSAAGGNSALLVEDAPPKRESPGEAALIDPRQHHVVAVSARNAVSLEGNIRSMLKYLGENPDVQLGKLSYTTTARRLHHQHRVMVTGSNVEDIATQLQAALDEKTGVTRPKGALKVVFAFTGQGAHYPGMGKELFENFSVFRTEVHRLDRLGQTMGFPSVLPVIQSPANDIDIGTFQPSAVQLAGVCTQMALCKLWAAWNITPTAVVGHSLGEYPALNAAGVLSDADTIYLVGKRAQLLEEKCVRGTHSMLAIKASVDQITGALENMKYHVACINSPVETVLAAPNEELYALKDVLTAAGFKSTPLKVPYAFHSPQVDPVLADFNNLSGGVTFSRPRIPILSALDGNLHVDDHFFGPEYLIRHTREPVNMHRTLLTAAREHVITELTTVLEIGSHPAVSGMVKGVLGPQVSCLATASRGRPNLQVLAATLKVLYMKGADICWPQYHIDFKASHEVIPLPAYSWDLKSYWIQYVNDWSLRKGDPPQVIQSSPALESTTVHRVVEETHDSTRTRIVIEADIARKDLSPLVQGHEVDNIPLCTPSVYADMALTLGTYLLKRYRPDQNDSLVDVTDMVISKALILRAGASEQLLQAHADADWAANAVTIKFKSFDARQKLQEHSQCVVRFRDRGILEDLQNNAPSVKAKTQALRDGIVTGETARFNRPMVYRAIRPLAKFHEDYRAIDEIVLNSETLEASSRLSFGDVKRGGTYHTHPAIIDSLTQSCGFTMNCNDRSDLDKEVFMNHGWGSLQIFEPLSFDKVYTTYTRMAEGSDHLWHGDVVIFDGDKVVAYIGQISIQGVPRRVLKTVLSIESGSQKKHQPAQMKQPHTATQANGHPVANGHAQATPTSGPVNGEPRASRFPRALEIIAEESGLSLADLTDTTVFSDVGIDSLLNLTISSRFKEEFDVDLDFTALSQDYPTVASLRALLAEPESTNGMPAASSKGSIHFQEVPPMNGHKMNGHVTNGHSNGSSNGLPETAKVDFQRVLEIISEESGVALEELSEDTNFADAGIDSLLSLVIVSRFRDELELDIAHESLLMDCQSVADLKSYLLPQDHSKAENGVESAAKNGLAADAPAVSSMSQGIISNGNGETAEPLGASLLLRKKAVDHYVQKYTAGFNAPIPNGAGHESEKTDNAKVVLVTGASGSLGGHLVDQLAQRADVKTVVCLNREHNLEPYTHQQKAMRDKGIRSFDKIRSKLLVLQTDSSQPMLGLPKSQYEELVDSVTHVIHNAWPMSAKRPLDGFEKQFQTLRNLIDFACVVTSRRPKSFKFSFQLVSSIGVVGHHGLSKPHDRKGKTIVPESRVNIDSVLPNGYSEAKWACERMLDETLHKHYADRVRTMVVRLGQIAGSKRCGYWNPTEHFGFLIKSSQTLNALPDVPGMVYWTPVEEVAGSLVDLILADNRPYPVYHVDNPIGQPWSEMNKVLADALNIPNLVPFVEWVERVRSAPHRDNPAAMLSDFFIDNYLRMSCGGLVLDVKNTLEHSRVLSGVGPVTEDVVRKYIHVWREIGFLK